jgi:hypothetical protein
MKLAILLVALWGCPKPFQFQPRVAELHRVAILPADVDIVRIVFSGDPEPLDEEAAIARRELPRAIAPVLERHGFTVVPAHLDETDLTEHPDLRYPLTMAQKGCVGLANGLRAGKKFNSLGPDVGLLAEHAGADALLCVAFAGADKSAGQISRDVAVTVLTLGSLVYPTSLCLLFVALVDGTTGYVHWWGWLQRDTLIYQGTPLDELADQVFTPMPMRPSAPAPQAETNESAAPTS